MPEPLAKKFTLTDLRAARQSGRKVPMLTCYDFTMARLMQQAGVPALLVGDSAANVILGHLNTLPISLDFLIELTAAVRRGAPNCLLVADMPFGSYQASDAQGFKNIARMVQLSGCDCVKIEAAASHARLVARLADAGVAMIAHLGLRPQTVGLSGGYHARGRTAADADKIVQLAVRMERAGAAAILLEAVPPETGMAVVEAVGVPVIGCGAGPACHAHVVVTHDAIGWTAGNKPRFVPQPAERAKDAAGQLGTAGNKPRFVPQLADLGKPMVDCFKEYVRLVTEGQYPSHEHFYEMPSEEKAAFTHAKPSQRKSV